MVLRPAMPLIRWEDREVFLDENTSNVANKPSRILRGVFGGYSMPEYAPGQELLFRMRVPFEWDGVTSPVFAFISSISATETVGKHYKFQLEWSSSDIKYVIPSGITETITNEVTVQDGTAYYAEIIQLVLTPSTIVSGQNLQMRLRRISPTVPSVSNEIIIWHWTSRWKMNKLGTISASGY